jgi:hypothetical protein
MPRSLQPEHPAKTITSEIERLRRVGFGELAIPGIGRYVARVIFLDRLGSLCRSHLRELKRSCLPAYQALFEHGRRKFPGSRSDFPEVELTSNVGPSQIRYEASRVDTWTVLARAAAVEPLAGVLKQKLWDWAEPRCLSVDWFLDVLMMKLLAWRMQPTTTAEEFLLTIPGTFLSSPNERLGGPQVLTKFLKDLARFGPEIEFPVYNPATQTREEHEAVVLERLGHYHEAREKFFRQAGFVPVPGKRARGSDPWEHMIWFIRRQIDGWPVGKIAQHTRQGNIDESSVNRKIKEMAGLLAVPLRRTRPAK